MTDDDLAVVSSMERLATLAKRPGYAEAMRITTSSRALRTTMLVVSAGCGGLAYACLQSVASAWLRWFLVVLFGALAIAFVLIWIGMHPKLAGVKLGVAVVDKRLDGTKRRVTFLRENGTRMDLAVSEAIYGLLKPGDIGVVHCSGDEADYTVDGFERL